MKLIRLFLVTICLIIFCSSKSATYAQEPNTIWKYQCIDTMKISRDRAKTLTGIERKEKIDILMKAIADTGANCVAIGTPYDEEFLPVLKDWVDGARKYRLHVWFRGNFSSWEGWFDYERNITSDQVLNEGGVFIMRHPELFEDGDIFTLVPEAENGWPGNYVAQGDYGKFRKFLITEYTLSQQAFTRINKHIEVNWLSMNGGIARSMLDKETVDAIDKKVTIDHYVADTQGMDEYIDYFVKKFGAKVVLGEFGAPIPDINGNMTEDEQAVFVGRLLERLYAKKDSIEGINYWVIQEGSTALLNDDGTSRKVLGVLKKYFKPSTISGKIVDTSGIPLKNIDIATTDGLNKTKTDSNGYYHIVVPIKNTTLIYMAKSYMPIIKSFNPEFGEVYAVDITMQTIQKENFWSLLFTWIRLLWR